jgi:hypothetical protein
MRHCPLCLLVLLFALNGGASAETYDNSEYGLQVDLPARRTVCRTPPPGANHGFSILISAADCDHELDAQRVELFVAFNTASEAKTTAELIESACDGAPARPSNIKSDGVTFYRCNIQKIKGMSRIEYFGLRSANGKWVGQWEEVHVSVFCKNDMCPKAINLADELISGLKFRDY